jgi:hypothetical protein
MRYIQTAYEVALEPEEYEAFQRASVIALQLPLAIPWQFNP